MRKSTTNGLILLVLGLPVLGLGAGMLRTSALVVLDGQRTEGTVVDHYKSPGGRKSGPSYFPIVEFTTVAGEAVRAQADYGTRSRSDFPLKSKVDVFYDPNDPQSIKLDHFLDLWLGPLTPAALGLLVILAGVHQLRQRTELDRT